MSTKFKPADASRRFLKTAPCTSPHHMTRPPALNAGALKHIPISRAWVLGCLLVCGLWQNGAALTFLPIEPVGTNFATVNELYVGTGTYASITSYTDQTAFNAAVPGYVTQTFDTFNGFYLNGLDIPVLDYTVSASAPGNLYVGLGLMSTNSPDSLLTFSFSGTLPTAIGGSFLMTDASFGGLASPLSVFFNDGTFINLPAGTANTTGAFAGFTSNVGIASFSVGRPVEAAPEAVPEPGSSALLSLIGLLGVVVYRKCGRKL
jgi:hypothetical protein